MKTSPKNSGTGNKIQRQIGLEINKWRIRLSVPILPAGQSSVRAVPFSFSLKGTLKGFDQTVNVILSGSHERVYSTGSGVELVQLGLYIIRGDNMYVPGWVGHAQLF